MPCPSAFLYCCPQPLDDKSLGEKWKKFREEFRERTGIRIGFRDKHYLDTRLGRSPDLVAGLFSPSYAEHFCQQDGWTDNPWTRVTRESTHYPSLRRFLEYRAGDHIHIGPRERDPFHEILEREPVLLILGLPGVGKSMTGLTLACELREPIPAVSTIRASKMAPT